MVDLKFLNNIRLASYPHFQAFVARTFLIPNYNLFSKVTINIENIENLPKKETVIIAMNHTDRYNYWPLQYKLWRIGGFPYTTVWVKGKYFGNAVLKRFFAWANTFPVPSKGYFIEEFFKKTFNRKITFEEYRIIKDFIDNRLHFSDAFARASVEVRELLSDGWQRIARTGESFAHFIENYYAAAMERVAEISKSALFDKGLNIIIFPEGTRSLTLSEGRTGIAQLALNTGKTIVPIGCNNSERVYPGNLPFAKSGTITYRVGEPLRADGELREFAIREKFRLFSKVSQECYRENFEAVTALVMERIHRLLDERYRKDLSRNSSRRF
ncbi:MAG: lysophospholipid acyltransferase family protein [Spirochaetota bacterium]